MTKKLEENGKKIIILLIIAVLFVCSFRFGFATYKNKTDALKIENAALQAHLSELERMVSEQSVYEDGTAQANTEMQEVYTKYAAANTPEKTTLMLVNLEDYAGMDISAISFGAPEELFAATTIPTELGLGLVMYSEPVTIAYKTNYDGLKSCFNFLKSYSERMNSDSVTVSYDQETGNLTGTMSIRLYSLVGTEKQYEAPVIGGAALGSSNIFSTSGQ